ncbi:MAG: hypothetical protein GY860_23660 [Desulfobacteraceae bacterium]|nr:hypothetical protein [Desulfobacteraceae bacterium]
MPHKKQMTETGQEKAVLKNKLRSRMKLIGPLAGGIAHDFNNILSIIMGYAELAKVHIPQDSKAHIDIDQIFESSRRAADLVRQIRTISIKLSSTCAQIPCIPWKMRRAP